MPVGCVSTTDSSRARHHLGWARREHRISNIN